MFKPKSRQTVYLYRNESIINFYQIKSLFSELMEKPGESNIELNSDSTPTIQISKFPETLPTITEEKAKKFKKIKPKKSYSKGIKNIKFAKLPEYTGGGYTPKIACLIYNRGSSKNPNQKDVSS